jgi:hypothetical protein
MIPKLSSHNPQILVFASNFRNDVCIIFQQHIGIWIGEVTFTTLRVAYWTAYIKHIILKLCFRDSLILVFTFKLYERH